MREFEAFNVHIPANVYDGKYYDYRTVGYKVFKGHRGVHNEQDAIRWVNDNRHLVLSELDVKTVLSGSRKVKEVMRPIQQNVFFKDSYRVTTLTGCRAYNAKQRSNWNPTREAVCEPN